MRDFAETLDHRLRSLAAYSEPVSRLSVVPPAPADDAISALTVPVAERSRRRPTLRSPIFSGGMAAAIGAVATVILLTGSGASGLPILDTETSDASAVKSNATLSAAAVDFNEGHAFTTPDGTGWVFETRDGSTVCVSLPDRTTPGSGGAACAPRSTVERRGLAVELVGDLTYNPRAMAKVAYVLPAGATDVTLTTPDRTVALQTQAGVAVAWLRGPGTIAFRKDRRTERQRFSGPFPKGSYVTCKGRRVPTPPNPGPGTLVRC